MFALTACADDSRLTIQSDRPDATMTPSIESAAAPGLELDQPDAGRVRPSPPRGGSKLYDLRVRVEWNIDDPNDSVDVDLHVIPPREREWFGPEDCYYFRRSPIWGGRLDHDDTNGHGPEHVTLEKASTSTLAYRVGVHFFSSHWSPRTATVDVTIDCKDQRVAVPAAVLLERDLWRVADVYYLEHGACAIALVDEVTKDGDLDHLAR